MLLAGGAGWRFESRYSEPTSKGPWLAKLAPDGTVLGTWRFGQVYSDGVIAMAADAAGDAYVAGETSTWGTDYPERLIDGFLAKLDPAGNPVWIQRFTDPQRSVGVSGVAVDASGDACVSGQFAGAASVARYDASGALLWRTSLGTTSGLGARSVAIDALGNCYALVELTDGTFVVKLAPDGTVQ